MRATLSSGALIFSIVFLQAPTVPAQAPAGPEFRVSSAALAGSGHPSVSADAAGNFVVSWARHVHPTFFVHVRLFDAQGVPRGDDIVVAQHSSAVVSSSSVAREPGGAFVVAWDVLYGQDPGDVFARLFSAPGAPLGAAFQVNAFTTGFQSSPVVARAPDGTFVVVWSKEELLLPARLSARRFAADGTPLGPEFDVRSSPVDDLTYPAVATDDAGNFVVAWVNYRVVEGRRFSASGAPIGAHFQVNTIAQPIAMGTSVAMQPDGRFMVVWEDLAGRPPAIAARRFEADGTPMGGEFVVRSLYPDTSWTTRTSVSSLASGGFMVAWSNFAGDADSSSVEAKRFDAAGDPAGPSFLMNTTEADFQTSPALASDPEGNVVAVWRSRVPLGVFDVFGQRFGSLGAAALSVDASTSGGSDGNGVLEPGETVDLRPSWQNNTGEPLDLPATLATLTGPAGATYTIADGSGSYGTVPAGATRECVDCYRASVAAPSRPSTHWDAMATEHIGDGSTGLVRWPVHVGESFADVLRSSPFYRSVEILLHQGVTTGCGSGLYCPADAVTREQMAVLILVAKEERAYAPMRCLGPSQFSDVPMDSPFCRWIGELARRGVTGGCGGGHFCPSAAVSREQMAVFVLRTLDPTLDPPACTSPVFNDVPASSVFCRWIEELARRGVVGGCGGGRYCPADPVRREQMAVFLTGTFGLTLYGP